MTKHTTNMDQETVLKALDQLSNTIDAMSQVVKRLKNDLESHSSSTTSPHTAIVFCANGNKTLH